RCSPLTSWAVAGPRGCRLEPQSRLKHRRTAAAAATQVERQRQPVTLLVKHAAVMVTMDGKRREIPDGALFVRDKIIEMVDSSAAVDAWMAELPQVRRPDRVIDAHGTVLIPGLVNCHHHLYQTLTRAIATAKGLSLFDWLKTLYPLWAELDGEAVYVSAK